MREEKSERAREREGERESKSEWCGCLNIHEDTKKNWVYYRWQVRKSKLDSHRTKGRWIKQYKCLMKKKKYEIQHLSQWVEFFFSIKKKKSPYLWIFYNINDHLFMDMFLTTLSHILRDSTYIKGLKNCSCWYD